MHHHAGLLVDDDQIAILVDDIQRDRLGPGGDLIRLGQVDLAISRLSSQLLREPENRKARMLLGEAKLASQDPEGALETLAPVAGWADASPQELALLAKAQAQASGV